jgi:uncharacterized protein YecE (DUF72 family)
VRARAAEAWLLAPPPAAALARGPVPARVGNVRLGTASWTERTLLLSGDFYPAAASTPERRLRYYAHHFPVVEVDATYYALPSARNARAWAERTPPDFVFGVKAFAALTEHPVELARLDRDLAHALPGTLRAKRRVYPRELPPEILDEIWRRFRTALLPLAEAGKLGYLLFQLPSWCMPGRESAAYLESLPARLPGMRIAVEFRQADWMAEARRAQTLDRLRRLSLVYVSVDEPQGTRASVPPLAEATSEALAVVRFHGRRREAWTKRGASTTERFGYLYREAELAEWVPRIRTLTRRSREVHVLMNNCYRGHAVENAKELAEMLAGAGA